MNNEDFWGGFVTGVVCGFILTLIGYSILIGYLID
jgi:hypothetical protein